MFLELRKMSLRRLGIQLIESVVIIAFILLIFGADLIAFVKGPKNLDTLPISDIKDSYITTDIYAILDVFAEYYTEESNGDTSTTKSYYVIPVGEYEYMALEVPKDKDYTSKMEQIYDETYEYLLGNRDNLLTTSSVKGSINPLEGELYDLYMEWFHESGFMENVTEDDINSIALPYLLQIDHVGESSISTLKVMMGIILIILCYDIILLLLCLSGINLLPIKRYLKKEENLNPELLESDFMQAETLGKITFFRNSVRIGNRYTFYLSHCFTRVVNNEDIVWTYMENYTRKLYGLKLFTLQSLNLFTYHKKHYQIYINDQAIILKAIDLLIKKQPHMVAGYSDERKKLFKKDFDSFMKLTYDNTEMYEEDYTPPMDSTDYFYDIEDERNATHNHINPDVELNNKEEKDKEAYEV